MIRVHHFKSKTNFGDQLVTPIIKWICGEDTLWVTSQQKGKLLCIGSELAPISFEEQHRGVLKENDVVWGYGAKRPVPIIVPKGAVILATRGKYTADLLRGVKKPTVFGDPALLISNVFKAPTRTEQYEIGILPHFTDAKYFTHIRHPRVKVMDILSDKWGIIRDMHKCRIIMSTSLHGCIVAEAYGLPVVWMETAKSIVGGFEFKWNDYFSGTGRGPLKPNKLPLHMALKDLGKIKNNWLPKPEIDTTGIVSAWKEFYKSDGIDALRC